MTLRLVRPDPTPPVVPEVSSPGGGGPGFPAPRTDAARVLIATCPGAFAGRVAAILGRGGYACEAVHTGADVLGALREQAFDLLLCDVDLAGGDELDLVRQVATVAGDLPIMLTAERPTVASAIAAIDLPVVAYLVKPVGEAELLARAGRATARARSLRRLRDAERELQGWRDGLASRAAPAEGRTVSTALDGFLARTLQNLVGSLSDIEHARRVLGREDSPLPHACQAMNCPRGEQLREAVRHTITVLEATKGSFRSRTLAELRHQLELLLRHN